MDPEDKEKTAFTANYQTYQYNFMPFGLKSGPSTFQRLMTIAMAGLQGLKCLIYMDDILIYAQTLEEHNEKLKSVFERLRVHKLKLQPDKCEFLRRELCYLGHVLTEDGIKPDPSKIEAVKNYPVPKDVKQIQSFIGFAGYYRRFIKDFSKIIKPLVKLLKKNVPFNWDAHCDQAFQTLKEKLISPPILQYPDYKKEFILTTDASKYAIGSVLAQGELGKELPVAYASRVLNKAEINYSVIEKEMLAIVWSVLHYRPYLFNRHFTVVTDHKPLSQALSLKDPTGRIGRWRLKLVDYSFDIKYKKGSLNVVADPLSRIYAINTANLPEQILQNEFENFEQEKLTKIFINTNIKDEPGDLFDAPLDFSLTHTVSKDLKMSKGIAKTFVEKFGSVDRLKSQNPTLHNLVFLEHHNQFIIYLITKNYFYEKPSYRDIFFTLLKLKQFCIDNNIKKLAMPKIGCGLDKLKYENIRIMLRYIFLQTNIEVRIYHNEIIKQNFTRDEINNILTETHVTPLGGHTGIKRTLKKLKKLYNWQYMKKDIVDYISKCELCQKNKITRHCKEPMVITTTATRAMQKVNLDLVGPLPVTRNSNKYLLTIQCDLTKFAEAIPIRNQEANTVAEAFATKFICRHGIPDQILTDQGSNFMSNIFKETCKQLKIKKLNISAFRPESNPVERSHRSLKEYLRIFIDKDQTTWDQWIPYAMFSYNSTPHSITNMSPFELLYGRQAKIPSIYNKEPEINYNYDDYSFELKSRLQNAQTVAREKLIDQKRISKVYYDRKINPITYQIGDRVLLKSEQPPVGHNKKLSPLYTGPYLVVDVNSDVNCTLLYKNKHMRVHNNRLKIFSE